MNFLPGSGTRGLPPKLEQLSDIGVDSAGQAAVWTLSLEADDGSVSGRT